MLSLVQAGTIEKHWRKLQATAKVTPPAVDSGVESSSEQVEGEEVKEEAKAEE